MIITSNLVIGLFIIIVCCWGIILVKIDPGVPVAAMSAGLLIILFAFCLFGLEAHCTEHYEITATVTEKIIDYHTVYIFTTNDVYSTKNIYVYQIIEIGKEYQFGLYRYNFNEIEKSYIESINGVKVK